MRLMHLPALLKKSMPSQTGILASIIAILFSILSQSATGAYVLQEKKWTVNGYTFTKKRFNWNGEDHGSLDVSLRGKRLLHRQAHDVWVWTRNGKGEFVEAEDQNRLSLTDLDGDGVLDFVVRQWSGGAYCCYVYEVFSLTPDCSRLWSNDAGCAHLSIIEPRLTRKPKVQAASTSKQQSFHSGNLRQSSTLAMEDGVFLYWRTHVLQGPRPIAYFTGNGHGFKLNRTMMLKAVDQERLRKFKSEKWTNDSEDFFIQLVYTGHAREALSLLDSLEDSERHEFAQSFMQAFKRSPFYYSIVALNDKFEIAKLQKLAKNAGT